MRTPSIILAFALALAAAPAAAQMPPSYDFDFVTITDTNNIPYSGDPQWGVMGGRGNVGYEYRISRMQVTTAQWMEFLNAVSPLGGSWTHFGRPSRWGAVRDHSYTGPGWQYKLDPSFPDAHRMYVGGISWRHAAIYCNWLHNGKVAAEWALGDGAYDTSTFGPGALGLPFTDQATRHPDAKFWIPSLDEWIKAAHYDPDRYGPGQPGWWEYSYMSDKPPISGPPGVGQTSAGYEGPIGGPQYWEIPLGAYPEMMSPWGLWDTSGATSEWIEEIHEWWGYGPRARFLKGTTAGDVQPPSWHHDLEAIWVVADSPPWAGSPQYGVRIASAVPAPATGAIIAFVGGVFLLSRRRTS